MGIGRATTLQCSCSRTLRTRPFPGLLDGPGEELLAESLSKALCRPTSSPCPKLSLVREQPRMHSARRFEPRCDPRSTPAATQRVGRMVVAECNARSHQCQRSHEAFHHTQQALVIAKFRRWSSRLTSRPSRSAPIRCLCTVRRHGVAILDRSMSWARRRSLRRTGNRAPLEALRAAYGDRERQDSRRPRDPAEPNIGRLLMLCSRKCAATSRRAASM